ncbi:DNA recombination protein RecF [Bifidobacterium leontopitheci]|uniref:DNA replication and repair protein RecF n=1 Tax=Bifidobacterium leontopitheci TaxID=2650774 RepID=A0A6I1GFE0_9BIFI|nr:DNA recombination protein RecF [Bifidobacterium leontopitheci]
MYISRLALDHFRSWRHCVLDLKPGVNVLQGANGLGKTNLVEAVEVLSTGGSHRTTGSMPLIERGEKTATIRANVEGARRGSGDTVTLEATVNLRGANRARVNGGQSRYLREIVGDIPTVSFTPEDQQFVAGDPAVRRQFLDQAASLLIPGYAAQLQTFTRIAKQRAALLKQLGNRQKAGEPLDAALSGLEIWTGQFITAGVALSRQRQRLIERLNRSFGPLYARLAGLDGTAGDVSASGGIARLGGDYGTDGVTASGAGDDVTEDDVTADGVTADDGAADSGSVIGDSGSVIDDHVTDSASGNGFAAGLTYAPSFEEILYSDAPEPLISEHFQRIYAGEVARGINLIGPQRDDITVTLDGMPAREFASNGETWTLALALRMAQYQALCEEFDERPIVILDDVFAQLDETRRQEIMRFAARQDQVLITVAAASDIPAVAVAGNRDDVSDVVGGDVVGGDVVGGDVVNEDVVGKDVVGKDVVGKDVVNELAVPMHLIDVAQLAAQQNAEAE